MVQCGLARAGADLAGETSSGAAVVGRTDTHQHRLSQTLAEGFTWDIAAVQTCFSLRMTALDTSALFGADTHAQLDVVYGQHGEILITGCGGQRFSSSL